MVRKLKGKIVEWDDDRGFGFVQSGSARVFLHRREFSARRKKIEIRDRVIFTMGSDAQGRPCAKAVEQIEYGGRIRGRHFLIVGALLILPGMALTHLSLPWLYVGGYILVINLLTLLVYASDKKSAVRKRWRVRKSHLHLLELIGGWPAAFLAQRALRHKTSKVGFQIIFWLIVFIYQAVSWDLMNGGQWIRFGTN